MPSATRLTTGSSSSAPDCCALPADGDCRHGGGVLGEEERDRRERADQQHGHRKQPTLDELAPHVVDGFLRVHRVAPVTVAVVVGAAGPPAVAGDAAGVVAAGPFGVAPAVRPCVSGTR